MQTVGRAVEADVGRHGPLPQNRIKCRRVSALMHETTLVNYSKKLRGWSRHNAALRSSGMAGLLSRRASAGNGDPPRRRPNHRRSVPCGVPRKTWTSRRVSRLKCRGPDMHAVIVARRRRAFPVGVEDTVGSDWEFRPPPAVAPQFPAYDGCAEAAALNRDGNPYGLRQDGIAAIRKTGAGKDFGSADSVGSAWTRRPDTVVGPEHPGLGTWCSRKWDTGPDFKCPFPEAGRHGAVSRGAAARLPRPVRRLFRNACKGRRPVRTPRSLASR